MGEWIENKLGALVSTNTASVGADFPFKEIIYLDTGSITRGKIDAYQEFRLSEAPSRAKRLVKEQDIIYSTVRPIQRHYGYITTPPGNLVVSTGFAVITCNQEKLFPKYLYYYLSSDQIVEELDVIAEASTSTYPSLKPGDIENLDFRFPKDTKEQKAIASVLSSVDDKIDLLHRQNKTLEAMGETLFRQWFIEETPEDWGEIILSDLATITRGASPRPIIDYVKNGTVPWIKIADATGSSSFYIDSTNEFIIESGVSKSVEVYPGDLILSNSATCGLPYFMEIYGCIHDGWLLFRNFNGVSRYFVFFFLKQINKELNQVADGSVQDNLNTEILKNYPLRRPSRDRLEVFDNTIEPLIGKMKFNNKQIRTLEQLRDTMLPKLMRGEARVDYGH